ncbi:MAG TPA: hypothetical protein VN956_00710 [Pyrinomonadaceae bacterium]|nr:hypothetical protein [Pyrinomonadaceae bacterium]
MAGGLKNNLQIWKLARDLGLPGRDDPLTEIISYCASRMRKLLNQFPCHSLSQLLENAATHLDTNFREIHSDDELKEVRDHFFRRGEKEFALLDHELKPGVFAITFKRLKPKPGERQFISIIDCRGEKAFRSYFSKWHELAHLLTLTDQGRLKFCRTHSSLNKRDPEEALMEAIAGHVGFLPEMIRTHAKGPISFEKIMMVKQALCAEASVQSATIGIAKGWPMPCMLLEASLQYKKSDRDKLHQPGFDFVSPPQADLRIVHVNHNGGASNIAKYLHKNMRIPTRSIIHRAFDGEAPVSMRANESLGWWETKRGGYLPPIPMIVEARKQANSVHALLVPKAT